MSRDGGEEEETRTLGSMDITKEAAPFEEIDEAVVLGEAEEATAFVEIKEALGVEFGNGGE